MSETSINASVLEEFRLVAKMIAEVSIRADAHAKATYQRFNVFTTLLSSHDEVRLHTRFLHCLLDPHGFHDCESLFLNLFFATLNEMPGVDHDGNAALFELPATGKTWKVEKEASRGFHGRIDLLLETQAFGLAIENKIYGYEQVDQLARYGRYLRGKYKNAFRVIYLTLDGKESSTHGGIPYLRISYAEHVLAWLEKCLRETYHIIPISQVLVQYREVVRKLTGKTIESAAMKPISDFIFEHPDVIRYKNEIDAAIQPARYTFLDRLAAGIISELQGEFQVRLRSNLDQGRFGVDKNGALIITPPLESLLRQHHFEIWVESMHQWGNALIVGIESKYEKDPLSAENSRLLRQMDLILRRENERANPLPTWSGTHWPTGWHSLIHPINDEKLASLLETPIPKTVSKVCEDIRDQIKLLERACCEALALPPSPDAVGLP